MGRGFGLKSEIATDRIERWCRGLTDHWAFNMGLKCQWQIKVTFNDRNQLTGLPEEESVITAEATVLADYMSAHIRFFPNHMVNMSYGEVEGLVVHELCHIFTEICKENIELAAQYMANALLIVETNGAKSERYPKPTKTRRVENK